MHVTTLAHSLNPCDTLSEILAHPPK